MMNPTLLRQTAIRTPRFVLRTSGLASAQSTSRLVAAQGLVHGRLYTDKPDPTQFNTRSATDPPPPFSGPNLGTTGANQNTTSSSGYNPAFSSMDGTTPGDQHDPTVVPSSKLGPWLTALLVAGLGLFAFGAGEMWSSMTMWPKEVRGDLRQGLKEAMKGDKLMAERYLTRAWETAKSLPSASFEGRGFGPGTGARLKTTGIAIALAGVYEEDGKPEKAYEVYQDALRSMQVPRASKVVGTGPIIGVDEEPAPGTVNQGGRVASAENVPAVRLLPRLSPFERMRAVAISYKLAELAHKMELPKEEEEKWLVQSVETVLRDVMGTPRVAEVIVTSRDESTGKENQEARGIVEQLRLPPWAFKHDLAAPFEALGTFYSRQGRVDYALPLFLQAVTILIPPAPQVSSSDDQCRGAQIMGNIAELIVRTSHSPSGEPSAEALIQAESWAQKGLDVASKVRKSTFLKHPECEVAYAFSLFNLGMIREMAGDQAKARQLFTESLDQSKSIGLAAGIENAQHAINSMGSHSLGITSGLSPVASSPSDMVDKNV